MIYQYFIIFFFSGWGNALRREIFCSYCEFESPTRSLLVTFLRRHPHHHLHYKPLFPLSAPRAVGAVVVGPYSPSHVCRTTDLQLYVGVVDILPVGFIIIHFIMIIMDFYCSLRNSFPPFFIIQ